MISILIDTKIWKIFWFLWRHKKEPYTIREVARQTNVSYGSTWSILKEFEELKLAYGIEKRKAHLYVLNFEHPLCFHVWSLLNALKREKLEIDVELREKAAGVKGFVVLYTDNDVFEAICCSEKPVKGLQSLTPEDFKNMCNEKKEFYEMLWNEGVVLVGEREFYDFMWELAEKKVIGVVV